MLSARPAIWHWEDRRTMTYFEKIKQNDEAFLAGMIAELMVYQTADLLGLQADKLKHTRTCAKAEIEKLLKSEADNG